MQIPSLTVEELQAELASSRPPVILDVREPHELEISALPGALHIPMGDLPNRLEEVPRDADLVILCRSGSRSAHVTAYLLGQGFPRVRNVAEGILGWARRIDPLMAQY